MALQPCDRVLARCDKLKIEQQIRKETESDVYYNTGVFYSKDLLRYVTMVFKSYTVYTKITKIQIRLLCLREVNMSSEFCQMPKSCAIYWKQVNDNFPIPNTNAKICMYIFKSLAFNILNVSHGLPILLQCVLP